MYSKSSSSSSSSLCYNLLGVSVIFMLLGCSFGDPAKEAELNHQNLVENNQNNENDSQLDLIKKSLDRYRYLGSLGKRFIDNEIDLSNEDADQDGLSLLQKRLDKMKYFGGLGKRTQDLNEDDYDEDDVNLLEKRLDKMKYFGGLGKKRSMELSENIIKNKKNTLLAKKSKSNIDRFRYMGNLGK